MFRIGLALYLVLVMAVGPALCCCTTQHIVANLAGAGGGKKAQQGSGQHACCHHQTSGSQHRERPQGSGSPGQPAPSPCPCNEQGSHFMPLLADDAGAAQQFQAKQLLHGTCQFLPILPESLQLLLSGILGAFDEATALPFLTAQDILYTFHMLRC
jgi:hypothetical protein